MDKESYRIEVRTPDGTEWRTIQMTKDMAGAVNVADAIHNLSFLLERPVMVRVRERHSEGLVD